MATLAWLEHLEGTAGGATGGAAGGAVRAQRTFRCDAPGCTVSYADRTSLWRHRRRNHTDPAQRKHACAHPGCGKRFPRADALVSHACSHWAEAKRVRAVEAVRTELAQCAAAVQDLSAQLEAALQARQRAEAALVEASDATPAEPAVEGACRVCKQPQAVDGRRLRSCHHCAALVHARCVCLFELAPEVELFCPACLKSLGITAAQLEHAHFECVGLPGALRARRLQVQRVPADGDCFFAAVALATGGAQGDAEVLRKRAALLVQELARWAKAQARKPKSKDADCAHWREVFAAHKAADARFIERVLDSAAKLGRTAPRGGEPWNSPAMDLVPMVMTSVIGRPIHVWVYSYHLRGLPERPEMRRVWKLPVGMLEPAAPPLDEPIVLSRTKAGILLAHYDLVLPMQRA